MYKWLRNYMVIGYKIRNNPFPMKITTYFTNSFIVTASCACHMTNDVYGSNPPVDQLSEITYFYNWMKFLILQITCESPRSITTLMLFQ